MIPGGYIGTVPAFSQSFIYRSAIGWIIHIINFALRSAVAKLGQRRFIRSVRCTRN